MPRALALTWELVKSDLPDAVKKATVIEFDRVLGLDLANWQPAEEEVPLEILALVKRREQARQDRRWEEADALRDQVRELGYEIEDTGRGPQVRSR